MYGRVNIIETHIETYSLSLAFYIQNWERQYQDTPSRSCRCQKHSSLLPMYNSSSARPGDRGQFPRQKADSRLACLAQGAGEGTLGALHTVQLEVGLSACAFDNLQKLLQFLRLTLLATPALLIIMIIVLTCIQTGNLATWPLLFTIIIIPIAVGEPYTVKAFPTVGLGLERKASTEFSDAEANTHQQCSSGLLGAS